MKPPKIRNRIAGDFRARILSGTLAEGSRLPTEKEMARHLGIARETMREALSLLEEENLVERIPGRGTFVTSRKRDDKVISFLLPCADILADRIGYSNSLITRELLCGVITEGAKRNCRVETVALSPVNRNDKIDPRVLAHLNSSSRVVIFSLWYRTIFEQLEKSGCRAALLTLGNENDFPPLSHFTDQWLHFRNDVPDLLKTADRYLRTECECRKTAVVDPALQGLDKGPFDFMPRFRYPKQYSLWTLEDRKHFMSQLAACWKKERFDGLLLKVSELPSVDFSRSLAFNCGLPDSVRIVTSGESPYNTRLLPHTPAIRCDFREAGAQIARELTNPDYRPREIRLESFIDSCQS